MGPRQSLKLHARLQLNLCSHVCNVKLFTLFKLFKLFKLLPLFIIDAGLPSGSTRCVAALIVITACACSDRVGHQQQHFAQPSATTRTRRRATRKRDNNCTATMFAIFNGTRQERPQFTHFHSALAVHCMPMLPATFLSSNTFTQLHNYTCADISCSQSTSNPPPINASQLRLCYAGNSNRYRVLHT